MVKVIVIGSGNVAQHLVAAFLQTDEIELVQVYARDASQWSHLDGRVPVTDDLDAIAIADLYLIAVTDDAIGSISEKLPFNHRLVAHTSGSVSIDGLAPNNKRGVFYPLQTFSKNKPVDFSTIPICLETDASDFELLEKVARSISNHIHPIDSEQRQALHVAAVFVNNFTNHLYQIGQEICQEHQVPFEILNPLITETAQKIMLLSPSEAQTGPAKRNDTATIEAHEAFLSNENHLTIYKTLTQSIQHNGKKL